MIGFEVVQVLLHCPREVVQVVLNAFPFDKQRLDQLHFHQLLKGACEFAFGLEDYFYVTLLAFFVLGEAVFDLLDRKLAVRGGESLEDGFGFLGVNAHE